MNVIRILAVSAALAVSAISTPSLAAQTVVDFSGHGTGGQIGATYNPIGLNFSTAAFYQCGSGCPAPTPNGFFAANGGNSFTAYFTTLQSSISFQTVSFSSTLAQAFDAMNNLVASVSDNQGFPVTNQTDVLNGTGISYVTFSYNGGNNGPAITNLTFDSTPAVPEPATWAMMLMGFAGIGASMRRRRRVSTARTQAA